MSGLRSLATRALRASLRARAETLRAVSGIRRAGPRAAPILVAALAALAVAQGAVAARRVAPASAPSPATARPARSAAHPAAPPETNELAHVPLPRSRERATQLRTTRAETERDVELFGGLGAWIDVYNDDLDPRRAVREMAGRGVRTLYIQTGRWNLPHDVEPYVKPWLAESHRAGLKVVGWYLPGYGDVRKDLRRTIAVARYRFRGHRFDGLGIDIEWRGEVRRRSAWNERVVRHARAARRALSDYPIAAITPSPLQMRVAPRYWRGFPWKPLARVSDAVMTMSYWSYRDDCPRKRVHCAYQYTREDVRLARKLTGGRVPIHIIGGVGDAVSVREVRDFVKAARRARPFGASFYDFGVTPSSYWRYLQRLRGL